MASCSASRYYSTASIPQEREGCGRYYSTASNPQEWEGCGAGEMSTAAAAAPMSASSGSGYVASESCAKICEGFDAADAGDESNLSTNLSDESHISDGDLASVTSELFVHIGAGLQLRDLAACAAASQAFAERVQEEMKRRDAATLQLHAWSNHPCWHISLKKVCGLDWREREFKALPPMNDGRSNAVCAMIGNFIYVCGGSRHGQPTNAAERFSLERGTWEILPPMLGRRRVDGDTSVAVLGGCLYICGGTGFDGKSASDYVDRFDPENWHWEILAPMPAKRRGASAAVLSERLYICGGLSRQGSGLEVLCFDPATSSWEVLPAMLGAHYRAQAVIVNDTILVGQRFCPSDARSARLSLTQCERFQRQLRN